MRLRLSEECLLRFRGLSDLEFCLLEFQNNRVSFYRKCSFARSSKFFAPEQRRVDGAKDLGERASQYIRFAGPALACSDCPFVALQVYDDSGSIDDKSASALPCSSTSAHVPRNLSGIILT